MQRSLVIVLPVSLVLVLLAFFLFQSSNGQREAEKAELKEDSITNKQVIKSYDVVVVGGEPEGVAAAIAAARNGAKTLLIEHRDGLGGLFTYGKMNVLDIPRGKDKQVTSKGIFTEWHQMVGGSDVFDPNQAKQAFLSLVNDEENLTLMLNTEVTKINKEGTHINSIDLKQENTIHSIQGHRYIDATQDADFAVLSGVPYYVGAEDIGFKERKMAVTLMMHLKGLDWSGIKETAKSQKFGKGWVTKDAAWGFGRLTQMYEPVDEHTRLRGLNLVRLGDDYYINALQIFGVDGLSDESKQEAIERGKKETVHAVQYLRENFHGFENAEIASYPPELYVRETRHIKSLYQLPVSDLWENRFHWDTIAYGGYPSDIQATSKNDYGAVIVNPTQYGIPFRSLVPLKVDNLLVVGRSGGYSSLAAGSVRIVATGMATGEAAGTAAALSVDHSINFKELASDKEKIKQLRAQLKEQGAKVTTFKLGYPYQGKDYYPIIKELLNRFGVTGGYKNDVKEDIPLINKEFGRILARVCRSYSVHDEKMLENSKYFYSYNSKVKEKIVTVEEIKVMLDGMPYKEFKVNGVPFTSHYKNVIASNNKEGKLIQLDGYLIIGKLFGWDKGDKE